MAKNTKKPATNYGKPITSFFARTPKAPPSSQDAPSSSSGTTPSANSSKTKPNADISPALNTVLEPPVEVPKTSTKNSVPQERGASVSSSRKPETRSTSQVPLNPSSSSSSSLKRSRIPDAQPNLKASTSRKRSESLKSVDRRKGKFDSDSDVEPGSAVVYVTSTPNTQRRKKARLSPPEEEVLQTIIPSSQSEEEELVFNIPSPHTPKTMTNDCRPQADPITPERVKQNDTSMDIRGDSTIDEVPNNFESMSADTTPQQNLPSTDQMLTPPPSDFRSVPPTPEVLDAATKTAKIIADIKAKAYAETVSSPEPAPLEFNEELDSSSEEEDIVPLPGLTKRTVTNPSSSSVEPTRRSTRYSLRNNSPSSPSNGSRQKPPTRQHAQEKTSPSRKPVQNSRGKKVTSANPFAALLKEKRAAERRGAGDEAFRQAEIIVNNIDKYSLSEDIDMDLDEDTIDWDAAARTAREMPWHVDNSSSPNNAGSSSPQLNIGDEDQRTLFGGKKGKGKGQNIVDILEKDKVSEQEKESSQVKAGIRIWASSNVGIDGGENSMAVDEEIPCRQLPGDSAILRLLNACIERHDISQASVLLDMDILFYVPISERPLLAASLCSLALSPHSGELGEPATHALDYFWSSSSEDMNSTINFAQIIETFNQLGMESSLLTSHNWTAHASRLSTDVDFEQRDIIIQRLLLLVSACASSKRLAVTDIPNMILALLLLGMDSDASPDLSEDVTRVVDLVCHCLSVENQDIENDLCLKILRCIESYTPSNKARIISVMSAGSGTTRRITNIVSYNVITENNDGEKAILSELLPLPEVVDQLVSYSGRDGTTPGKFAVNEHTNYDDLGCYIVILGVAVSNIRGYVIQERLSKSKISIAPRPESPSKSGEKQSSDMQMLIDSLENLHNKISDTRAAHLERSRAKATIKGLSMNIHYQYRFWQRYDAEKSKTLAQYFKKKDKP